MSFSKVQGVNITNRYPDGGMLVLKGQGDASWYQYRDPDGMYYPLRSAYIHRNWASINVPVRYDNWLVWLEDCIACIFDTVTKTISKSPFPIKANVRCFLSHEKRLYAKVPKDATTTSLYCKGETGWEFFFDYAANHEPVWNNSVVGIVYYTGPKIMAAVYHLVSGKKMLDVDISDFTRIASLELLPKGEIMLNNELYVPASSDDKQEASATVSG